MSPERYFIKSGYRHNPDHATLDLTDNNDYWNVDRIATAGSFQYDVYRLAVQQLSKCGGSSLLDVGCGPPQKLAQMLDDRNHLVQLVDQPNTAAEAARIMPGAGFVPVNLEEIDLELNRHFDLVICADVIEHLLDPDPCLNFIQRHLKPSGRLFISTPERDVLRGKSCMHSPHPMHVREWNRVEFSRFLRSRGFEIEKQHLLPQRLTPVAKRTYGEIMARFGFPPQWFSCQLAVCRLAGR